MKTKMKAYSLLVMALLVMAIVPSVLAAGVVSTKGIDITTEDFAPMVWMCDNRVMYDDPWQTGTTDDEVLVERQQNYAFTGESIRWDVLVMDKNGINKIEDVYATVGDDQSSGGGIRTITRTGTVTSCDSIPSTNTNWADNLVLNKFDSSLGTLVSAKIELNTEMVNSINIQNEDVGPITVTLNSNGAVNINPLDGPTVTSAISVSEDFVANQGPNIFNVSDADSENYTATNLGMYIASSGNTTFNLPANASATAQLSGSGNFIGGVNTRASAQACVKYTYEYEVRVPIGNNIEVNCVENLDLRTILPSCNARILEEELGEQDFDSDVMRYYTCELHVEPDMQGEYWITVEAQDLDGEVGTMDENEFFFLNPTIALSIDGDIAFENARPGTSTYSDTVLVGNDAEDGSGVRLEMFISGTNFYDSESSGAMCPTSNELDLENFAYFGTNGAYATSRWTNCANTAPGTPTEQCADAEGYMGIPYGDELREAKEIMGTEIYDDDIAALNYGDAANILTPGSEMALTFRLNLPEPCNGDFDTGSIFFWGEAI